MAYFKHYIGLPAGWGCEGLLKHVQENDGCLTELFLFLYTAHAKEESFPLSFLSPRAP